MLIVMAAFSMVLACPPSYPPTDPCPAACQPNVTGEPDLCNCADWNGDSVNAPDDLDEMIIDFFNSEPCADVNCDGLLNPDDISEFITIYFLCCMFSGCRE